MKFIILLLFFILTISNCQTDKSSSYKLYESFIHLVIIDGYYYVNICPPKDATLESGVNTITLDEGEEYWFNVSENAEKYSPSYYKIGIIEKSGQTLSVGNPTCVRNKQIFEPTSAKAEGKEPSYFEDGYWIYVIYKYNLVGIKSTSGSGEIQIKVP